MQLKNRFRSLKDPCRNEQVGTGERLQQLRSYWEETVEELGGAPTCVLLSSSFIGLHLASFVIISAWHPLHLSINSVHIKNLFIRHMISVSFGLSVYKLIIF